MNRRWTWNLCYSALVWSLLTLPGVAAPDPLTPAETIDRLSIYGQGLDLVPAFQPQVNPMSQVTSVTQLSDVQPTDWAYQALQSLVERYGCVVGYPDGSFRGNRPLSRYEFAAGLNACMDKASELIAQGLSDRVTKSDLAALQRLQEEFSAELATLRGRVDALEARTSTLEAQQFSTTTKLAGEAIFSIGGVVTGGDAANVDLPRNTTFANRVRLNFDTSFTGDDLLRTRLQVSNFADYVSSAANPLNEGRIRYANDSGNTFVLDALLYQFPLGDRTRITLDANAGASDDFANTINPFIDGDGGSGSLTQFGTRNPIYYYLDGIGAGIEHSFSDQLVLSLGYLSPVANDPTPGHGLFNGAYGALAQLLFQPSDRIKIGVYYINAYNTNPGGTGSNTANLVGLPALGGANVSTNSYGVGASFQLSPNIVINGWGGYTAARVIGSGDADIWNFAVSLAFPDLGGKGNLGGIIVGMEPKVTNVSGTVLRGQINADPDTSLHVEGFYTWRISDNVGVTPAVIWLTNPDHNAANNDIVIGLIRTTFSF
ncbi:MAG: iron uptake porin [Cyanobacteria bacterium]|nr:iron uptake porin [Cyanobacteriota bacterium]MDW8202169.1 iron uptake porin [Cyanobacteriota bacterium SKYGB_h_bin112]